MDVGIFMLVAAWLMDPPEPLQSVEYIARYETLAGCQQAVEDRLQGKYGGKYRKEITFHCLDLRRDP